jgi:aminoglycoside phosphotransferase family enzyme/predicted kinase
MTKGQSAAQMVTARCMVMVERLRNSPDWLPEEQPIEMLQTPISVVLLGRQHVLKVKKPVDYGFLNYTTLEGRRRACEAEVMLNRRLCPELYLGVQPISSEGGELRLSGEGEIVDYAVVMRRLPAERMLDKLIRRSAVAEATIDRIAEKLSGFHLRAANGPDIAGYGAPDRIRRLWEDNFSQAENYIDRTIAAADIQWMREWVDNWMEENEDLFLRRCREGRIRDGHGDLRAESICLTPTGPEIFDCLEFNNEFRAGDVAAEAALLAMDLDALGRPDLGYYFAERYQARSADPHLFKLLPFYKSFRALARGCVLSAQLDESTTSTVQHETALERAGHYFALARRYASPLDAPAVIAVAGLPGTGKTALARAIAGELGWRVVSADAVRQSLFGAFRDTSGLGVGFYNREANMLTSESMLRLSREWLNINGGVVIDASFRRESERARARSLAEDNGADWRLIEVSLHSELVRHRLNRRTQIGDGLTDASWENYLRQSQEYEPIAPDHQHLSLNAQDNLDALVRTATDWLRNPELK